MTPAAAWAITAVATLLVLTLTGRGLWRAFRPHRGATTATGATDEHWAITPTRKRRAPTGHPTTWAPTTAAPTMQAATTFAQAVLPPVPRTRHRADDAITGQVDGTAIRAALDAHTPVADVTQQLPRIAPRGQR